MGRVRVKHRREGAKRPRADVLHGPDPEVTCVEPARGSVGDSVRMRPRTAHHIGPRAGYYEVDTSCGNSGSPGFFELDEKLRNVSMVAENFPVSVVHTRKFNDDLNAGENIDQELYDFMLKHQPNYLK